MQYHRPQLAKSADEKFLASCNGSSSLVAEMKLDGHRVMIAKDQAWSRIGKSITSVGHIQAHLPDGLMLDGELVPREGAEGSDVVSHLRANDPEALEYVVFDVLYVEGKSVMHLPWTTRREIIEKLPRFTNTKLSTLYPMSQYTIDDLMALASDRGHEGIMIKRVSEPYKENSRSAWIKHKFTDTHDVVIVDANAKPSEWRVRPGEVGTDGKLYPDGLHTDPWTKGYVGLNYGYYDLQGNLRIVGSLGETGPREEMEKHIGKVAEVKGYGQYPTGALRHPVLLRWRDDKLPTDCTFAF
jgi:ATP-dependent DNA ligase